NKAKSNIQMNAGHGFSQESLQTDGEDALISKKLAKKVFHGNTAALNSSLELGTKNYNIIGVFSPPKTPY
ncbi:ABC transporter permease, partial [Lacticaseibacillus paracasei]